MSCFDIARWSSAASLSKRAETPLNSRLSICPVLNELSEIPHRLASLARA